MQYLGLSTIPFNEGKSLAVGRKPIPLGISSSLNCIGIKQGASAPIFDNLFQIFAGTIEVAKAMRFRESPTAIIAYR